MLEITASSCLESRGDVQLHAITVLLEGAVNHWLVVIERGAIGFVTAKPGLARRRFQQRTIDRYPSRARRPQAVRSGVSGLGAALEEPGTAVLEWVYAHAPAMLSPQRQAGPRLLAADAAAKKEPPEDGRSGAKRDSVGIEAFWQLCPAQGHGAGMAAVNISGPPCRARWNSG